MSKDEIKMKFLDGYANYEEHHKIKSDEPKRKKHHKGKRFK